MWSTSNERMSGVTASAFGTPVEVLSFENNLHRPVATKGKLVILTLACSLSPGDWRMLSGDASLMKYPEGGFPYVPGLDVCGRVVEAAPPFAIGDTVVATWGGTFGSGGLAEYCLVDSLMTVRKPDNVGCVEAAALANSGSHALNVLRTARINPGDRILVLGGSGGVGTALVQMARASEFNVSFIAATSTDTALLASIGVDRPIHYTTEEWWTLPEFKAHPFDVIIDCAEGASAWRRVSDGRAVLRRGGRFVAVVLNEWHIEATRWWHLAAILFPPLGRMIWSYFGSVRYTMYVGTLTSGLLDEVMQLANEGVVRAVLDPSSPFPFTSQGAISAFDVLRSRHAKGKVVVEVAN